MAEFAPFFRGHLGEKPAKWGRKKTHFSHFSTQKVQKKRTVRFNANQCYLLLRKRGQKTPKSAPFFLAHRGGIEGNLE